MKERSFRPPQAVLDTMSKFEGDPPVADLSDAVSLRNLRRLHAYLNNNGVIKTDLWDHQGGNAALMWSRRILRQEGVLKAQTAGDIFIPEVIDIQLGPNVIAGFTKEEPELVTTKFEQAGIPSSFIPGDGGTFVFYSGTPHDLPLTKVGTFNLPDVELGDIVMVDDSRSKASSIIKAAQDNVAGVQCYQLETLQAPVDIAWESLFLLKSTDMQECSANVLKVDDDLGLVIGWAIICTVEDQPYFDKQGDHIPDNGMLEASCDFMLNSRVAKEMHVGDEKGSVVFAWPMTKEIAKAFGIEVNQTGLMIAMKPDNKEMLNKFRDGTYNGFSIGGKRLAGHIEEVD